MAVTPKKRSTKAPASKDKDVEVITLRIGAADKRKLIAHCASRARAENRQISYNRALLELIQAL